MNQSLILAACLQVVLGDLAAPINSLIGELGTVDSRLKGWAASDGLDGALRIQEAMRPVSNAVSSLHSSVVAEPTFDEQTAHQAIQDFDNIVPALQTLLADLSSKSTDFRSIGAAPIVGRDLRELDPVVASVVAAVYSKIPNGIGCDVVSGASSIGSAISVALQNAGNHYSEQIATTFPSVTAQCTNVGRQGGHHADDVIGNELLERPPPTSTESAIRTESVISTGIATYRNVSVTGLSSPKPAAAPYAVPDNSTHGIPIQNSTSSSSPTYGSFQDALANKGSTIAASMAVFGAVMLPALL